MLDRCICVDVNGDCDPLQNACTIIVVLIVFCTNRCVCLYCIGLAYTFGHLCSAFQTSVYK